MNINQGFIELYKILTTLSIKSIESLLWLVFYYAVVFIVVGFIFEVGIREAKKEKDE